MVLIGSTKFVEVEKDIPYFLREEWKKKYEGKYKNTVLLEAVNYITDTLKYEFINNDLAAIFETDKKDISSRLSTIGQGACSRNNARVLKLAELIFR